MESQNHNLNEKSNDKINIEIIFLMMKPRRWWWAGITARELIEYDFSGISCPIAHARVSKSSPDDHLAAATGTLSTFLPAREPGPCTGTLTGLLHRWESNPFLIYGWNSGVGTSTYQTHLVRSIYYDPEEI